MNRARASEVMTHPVVTVRDTDSLTEVVRVLSTHRISGVPVLDGRGCLVGVVTEGDILLKESGVAGFTSLSFLHECAGRGEAQVRRDRLGGSRARDLMTTDVVTATPDTSVRDVAARMARHGVNRIPIVDHGRLAGIVTRADILKLFMRSDRALWYEARRVIRRDLQLEPEQFELTVADRVIRVTGSVDQPADIDLIRITLEEIDGVAAVDVTGITTGITAVTR